MSGESRDVCVQRPKFTHANHANPAKGLEQYFVEIRGIITLVFSSDAARRRPYSHRSPLIAHCVPLKILYKTVFSYKSSWKVESAQLENFYFPVGKLFFSNWKIKNSQ